MATVLGGASTVGTVRLGYVHGISGFWLCTALGLGIIALNWFMAKPLLKLHIYIVTQVLERRYNSAARQATEAATDPERTLVCGSDLPLPGKCICSA